MTDYEGGVIIIIHQANLFGVVGSVFQTHNHIHVLFTLVAVVLQKPTGLDGGHAAGILIIIIFEIYSNNVSVSCFTNVFLVSPAAAGTGYEFWLCFVLSPFICFLVYGLLYIILSMLLGPFFIVCERRSFMLLDLTCNKVGCWCPC
ncbi:hypothetical protein L2E82_40892 [Cichorium intybus]|uniref:Uncharacterized protein n=1 Tax=Cichorium intybus TaxID=13427 RepID=A0ACB9ALP2_CICIN|nr:hypothetical protein L2E82_40892 [Cichorium intybus]